MEAFDAYLMYLALKRHFTLGSGYDYFKYNGKTNASKASFDTRRDRYSFHKLSKKDHPRDFLVANFVRHGTNLWIGDLVSEPKYEETYKAWLKRKESMTYTFKNDLEKLSSLDGALRTNSGDYPELLKLMTKNEVCIETVIVLNDMLKFMDKWNKDISDPVIWPEIYNMCVKYKPFIEYDADKLKRVAIETAC
jgi:hypothetical protein